MSPEFHSLSLMIIATFLGGSGALLLKIGVDSFKFEKKFSIINENRYLFIGLAIWGLGILFNVFAYHKSDFSRVFPLTSLNYVWSSLFAFAFLKEEFNKAKLYSLFFIILGIIFIMQ